MAPQPPGGEAIRPLPRVALFARFPEPGRAKTRLIPALGPDGAAALHRRLTEQSLAVLQSSTLPFELRFTGAAEARFRDWLGAAVPLAEQGEGDLGARMARATAQAPAILVGADLPDLGRHHLEQAAAALQTHPAVIGPAEDGGYWLIGLSRPMPFLFEPMDWGTGVVFAETMARFAAHGIEPALLERLPDLDRPEDLRRWPHLAAP